MTLSACIKMIASGLVKQITTDELDVTFLKEVATKNSIPYYYYILLSVLQALFYFHRSFSGTADHSTHFSRYHIYCVYLREM